MATELAVNFLLSIQVLGFLVAGLNDVSPHFNGNGLIFNQRDPAPFRDKPRKAGS
jgi:hypothetical protein